MSHAADPAPRAPEGQLRQGGRVRRIRELGQVVLVETGPRLVHRYDAVVLATGAALDDLAADFGVRRHVQAGRGYSFSVPSRYLPENPLYFPGDRIACTPLDTPEGPRLRIAGMMEFRRADEPLAVTAERAFLAELNAGCSLPVAALGGLDEGELTLQGLVASLDGRQVVRLTGSGPATEPDRLGRVLAQQALAAGADAILEALHVGAS